VSPDDDKSDSGMVIDFADLSAIVKTHVVEVLDHQFINDFMVNPTAERMVEWIVGVLDDRLRFAGVELTRVRLYETTTGWVEWTP
jgi:6-pyruvoyltetrahydropterin/6-carboxytetrahydropterin synthase